MINMNYTFAMSQLEFHYFVTIVSSFTCTQIFCCANGITAVIICFL